MVHNKPLVLSPIRAEQLTEIDLLIQSADIAHSMKTPERNGGKNSPSSVLSMPSVSLDLSFEQGSNRVRSTVVVSEEGTELLLEEMDNLSFTSSSSDIYQTPNKPNIDRAAYSLLDDADSTCTPTTPIKRVTPKTPSSVDTDVCCYGYRLGCFPNSGSGENLHLIRLQGQLDKFLSDPLQLDSLCSDWQLFGIAATSTQKSSPILSPQDVKQALRNRAFNITERRKKMDAIRRDLCPFNATPVRYKKSPSRLGTVRSFDITQHAPAIARGSKDKKQEAGLASFFKAGCLCNPGHVGESPAVIRTQVLNAVHEDTCYDSDPETFLRRPSRRLHSSTRLNSIRISLDYSAGREDLTNNKENLGYDHAGLVPSPKRHLHVDYTDDNTVRRMVQEFMNEKNTLIIHTKGPTDKSFSPNAVKAWFERGQVRTLTA